MDLDFPRPSFAPALVYKDPRAALQFLEDAFGFEPFMIIKDSGGTILHAEMRFGDGLIMVGSEWDARTKAPSNTSGANTQTIHVHLTEDINAHCARARNAGATIVVEPADQFYGDRTYRALDPEGHLWTFGQTVKTVTPAEWDKVAGTTTSSRP